MLAHTLYGPLEVSRHPQTLPNTNMHARVLLDALGSVWLLGMALWLGLPAWILTISYTGRGHIVNERGHIFDFVGGLRPPYDTKRHRIRRELVEIYRLAGSNRKTEVGSPLKKLCAGWVPIIYLFYHIYIYIYII